jgi:hypothetical protein
VSGLRSRGSRRGRARRADHQHPVRFVVAFATNLGHEVRRRPDPK